MWKATDSRPAGLIAAGWSGRLIAALVIAFIAWQMATGGSLVFLLWGGLIAWILWAGASRSIQAGTARRELGRHTTASVMRPAVGIPQDAPVATLLQVRGFPVPVTVVTTDAEQRATADSGVESRTSAGTCASAEGSTRPTARCSASVSYTHLTLPTTPYV